MSRITSSVGLITGIPIEETISKLMVLAARPKDILANRTNLLASEKLAVSRMSSLLLAFKFESDKLGKASLFASKQVTSSDAAALSATIASGGNPTAGSYLFTPIQTASSQQFLSQSFAKDATIGEGSFTFRAGGFLNQGIALEELNGGAGVRRGSIRVTDQSGATAVIDLSSAATVDDVLKAINDNTTINVRAEAVGDAFRLTDQSGGSGNLSVQNVGSGNTATDLGLAGINVAAATATGSDVLALHENTKLSFLNDGTGVQLRNGFELGITFADASTLEIDFGDADTLGEVLDAINAADPARISAAISADGNRIEVNDLTTGSEEFVVANFAGGTAATDLGLTAAADNGTITGRRLVSGLRDTLVASLKGGQGLGTLGEIDVTNRNGVLSSVNLGGAETLGEIIDAINSQAVGVRAAVNPARNGIELTDTTGGTTSNLIVADGDANNSATKLGLVTNAAAASKNGGALERRRVSAATLLSSMNAGVGVKANDFKITDSAGNVGAVDLNPTGAEAKTLGDVIDRINSLNNIQVEARINDTGDGIVIIDTAGGSGKMKVEEVGKSTTARDLRILGEAVEVEIDGEPTQVLDGKELTTVTIGADDTLADVAKTINELGRGIKASVLNDGTGQRLSLSVDRTGAANAMLVDATGSAITLEEISSARDALMLYGTGSSGTGVLIRSTTNEFANVIDGVNLTINNGTQKPVTVTVKPMTTATVSTVEQFVLAFNSIRSALDELASFDADELTTGILFGTREALRVESDLTRLLSGRFFGVGSFDSLGAIGLSLDKDGRLELSRDRLNAALASDPAGVERLFTDENLGVSKKLKSVIERLVGDDNPLTNDRDALLVARSETLTSTIDANRERITQMEERLVRERERLTLEFARLESTIASFQKNLTALASMQVIPPLTSTRARSER